jgi:hypothetical protein
VLLPLQRRLSQRRAATTVALVPGENVEPQLNDGLVGQQCGLHPPAQAAQGERHDGCPQRGAGGEVAPRRVERDTDLKPLVTHGAHRGRSSNRVRRMGKRDPGLLRKAGAYRPDELGGRPPGTRLLNGPTPMQFLPSSLRALRLRAAGMPQSIFSVQASYPSACGDTLGREKGRGGLAPRPFALCPAAQAARRKSGSLQTTTEHAGDRD